MIKYFSNSKPLSLDLGLLFFRVMVGLMMLPHGWAKLANFAERMDKFSDPLGIGTTASLAGAVFSEFFCSLFLMLGLFTRAALLPLIFTFVVIAFVVHGEDPIGDKESPLLFLVSYIVLFLVGPGRFSVDARLK